MFGLGHYIYAGEDLPVSPQEENGDETPRKGSTQTKGKENTPPAASAEPESEDEDERFIPDNEKEAKIWVETAVTFIEKFCESYDELKAYWSANSESIAAVEQYPEQYETLRNQFAEARAKLEEDE